MKKRKTKKLIFVLRFSFYKTIARYVVEEYALMS